MSSKEELKEKNGISFLDILLVIFKRWKFIFITTFLSGVFILSLMILSKVIPAEKSFLPDIFSPDVKIMFRENSSSGGLGQLASDNSALLSFVGLSGGSVSKKSDKAEVILYTRECLDAVIDKNNLIEYYKLDKSNTPRSDARFILKENIGLNFDTKSSVMTLTYSDIDREFATVVLKSILNELESRYRMFEEEIITETISDLVQSLESAEQEFTDAQKEIIKYSQSHGIIDLQMQAEHQLSEIAALNKQALNLELEIDKLLEFKRSVDPEVMQKKKELRQINTLLEQRRIGFKEYSLDEIPIMKLPEIAAEFNNLKAELEAKSLIYYSLRSQLASSRLKLYSEASSFQIIDKPVVPEKKSAPSRAKYCVLFVMAMFFFSIFFVFVSEYFENLKKDTQEYEKLQEISNQFKFKKRETRRKKNKE